MDDEGNKRKLFNQFRNMNNIKRLKKYSETMNLKIQEVIVGSGHKRVPKKESEYLEIDETKCRDMTFIKKRILDSNGKTNCNVRLFNALHGLEIKNNSHINPTKIIFYEFEDKPVTMRPTPPLITVTDKKYQASEPNPWMESNFVSSTKKKENCNVTKLGQSSGIPKSKMMPISQIMYSVKPSTLLKTGKADKGIVCAESQYLITKALTSSEWSTNKQTFLLDLNNMSFIDSGSFRNAFCLRTEDGTLHCVKTLKKSAVEAGKDRIKVDPQELIAREVKMQSVAIYICTKFSQAAENALQGLNIKIRFTNLKMLSPIIGDSSVNKKLVDGIELTSPLTIEEFIHGEMQKYVNNDGVISEEESTARGVCEAYCHYSHHLTEGKIMVTDLQGFLVDRNLILTDPEICSEILCVEGEFLFGLGNLSYFGVQNFFKNHKCNSICSYLKLKKTSE